MKKILPCVIGLGYVGLPIFLRLQKKFQCIGYDIKKRRVNELNFKKDINGEFSQKELYLKNKSLFTSDLKKISERNFYIITVPTPIYQNKKPNLEPLINAIKMISKFIKKDDIIFIESTVYPGVTLKLGKIIQKKNNIIINKDFWVGYSPERINPGDKDKTVDKIKKIVSFENCPKKIINKILSVYKTISRKLVLSSSIKEAEMSKVIENIQRDINIAFMNEIMMISEKLNINFYNVKKLAETKWNFMKYDPGLVGGHCLPVDPYYLYDIAKKNNFSANFILTGRNVNNSMKKFVLNKVNKKIKDNQIKKILVAGISFKKNVSDFRNSIALEIFKNLKAKKNLYVDAVDPLIQSIGKLKIKKLHNINLNHYELIIYLVNHDVLNQKFSNLKKDKHNILDIFNYLK